MQRWLLFYCLALHQRERGRYDLSDRLMRSALSAAISEGCFPEQTVNGDINAAIGSEHSFETLTMNEFTDSGRWSMFDSSLGRPAV